MTPGPPHMSPSTPPASQPTKRGGVRVVVAGGGVGAARELQVCRGGVQLPVSGIQVDHVVSHPKQAVVRTAALKVTLH